MARNIVEVCFDSRLGRWSVDAYVAELSNGEHVHDEDCGRFDYKDDAVNEADDVASMRNALVRVETRDGREDETRSPK